MYSTQPLSEAAETAARVIRMLFCAARLVQTVCVTALLAFQAKCSLYDMWWALCGCSYTVGCIERTKPIRQVTRSKAEAWLPAQVKEKYACNKMTKRMELAAASQSKRPDCKLKKERRRWVRMNYCTRNELGWRGHLGPGNLPYDFAPMSLVLFDGHANH